jgi:hypothetical protein
MGGGTQASTVARARARLIPTATQIASANATAQATFLQVFANATFPATFSQAANDREENLNDFYFASKQKDVQANVVMICSILESVQDDPHGDYIDVQDEGLAGLPISIMTRLCIIHLQHENGYARARTLAKQCLEDRRRLDVQAIRGHTQMTEVYTPSGLGADHVAQDGLAHLDTTVWLGGYRQYWLNCPGGLGQVP